MCCSLQFAEDVFYDCLHVNEEDMVVLTDQRFLVVDRGRVALKQQARWSDVESVRLEPLRGSSSTTAYIQILCRGIGRVDLPADVAVGRVVADAMERLVHAVAAKAPGHPAP